MGIQASRSRAIWTISGQTLFRAVYELVREAASHLEAVAVADTKVTWIPDKTLSPAERMRLLRILFGPRTQGRNVRNSAAASHPVAGIEVDKDAPAAAVTPLGLAD
ncbi:hypothetical protein ACFCYX_40345 [Streptomyces populi]|uniref:hypothetical protein n=1 Tax=Streptomyces populi TaxID=2058924 RepID=UPI0013A6CF61|nr:hypothetical protein [Streptomyces populi]